MAEGSVPLISSEVLANPVDEARLTLIAAEVFATAVSEARGSAIAAGGAAVSRGDAKCSNIASTRDHRHDCWSVIRKDLAGPSPTELDLAAGSPGLHFRRALRLPSRNGGAGPSLLCRTALGNDRS
jgi:hypothetical protein